MKMHRSKTLRLATAAAFLTCGFAATAVTIAPASAESIDSSRETVLTSSSGQVWRVYVKPGERVYAEFTQRYLQPNPSYRYDREYVLHRPGEDLTQTIDRNAANGTTVRFDEIADAEGVWEINADETGGALGIPHHNRQSFDISVYDAAGNEILGRVWADGKHNLAQPSLTQNPTDVPAGTFDTSDITVHYLSDLGWLYRTTYHSYNGIYSRLAASNLGIVDVFNEYGEVAYRSMDNSLTVGPAGVQADINEGSPYTTSPHLYEGLKLYKIFFNEPADDLPETARLWNGQEIVVSRAQNPVMPELENLRYTRNGDNVHLVWDQANHDGETTIMLDIDGNGRFLDPVDVRSDTVVTEGQGRWTWDGRDGRGNRVDQTGRIEARVGIERGAEIHFLNDDAEVRGGLSNYLVNAPAGVDEADRSRLFWDDTQLSTFGVLQTSQPDGTAGVASNVPGGVHDLPGTNNDNGWGNTRIIQDWAYVPFNVSDSVNILARADLSVAKTADTDSAVRGGVVNYEVRLTNAAGGEVEPNARLIDDLADVLDDATYNGDAALRLEGPSGSAAAPVFNAGASTITWNGRLAAGQSAVLTYSVTINESSTGDDSLANRAVGTSDPNATVDTICDAIGGDCATTETAVERSPGLEVTKTSEIDPETGAVTYTLSATNEGDANYGPMNPARLVDDLSGVLDDADLDEDGEITVSRASGAEPASEDEMGVEADRLTWAGELATGDTVTLTYTVSPKEYEDQGDSILVNVLMDGTDPALVPADPFTCEEIADAASCAQTVDELPEPEPAPVVEEPAITDIIPKLGGPGALALIGGLGAIVAGAISVVVARRRKGADQGI